MSEFSNVDLTRLSREALSIARAFDKNKDKTLQESEFNCFMQEWDKEHKGKSPLLVQLNMKSLNDNVIEIAKRFDNLDGYKGTLTEAELKNFIEYCEKNNITKVFKTGATLNDIINGTDEYNESSSNQDAKSGQTSNKFSFLNKIEMYYKLLRNFRTFKSLNYLGSDKYFHAVGNYQSIQLADNESVKAAFDKEASKKKDRPIFDIAEDMFANWIGRELGEMYPGKDAYSLFEALAPEKMDIERCR